jgi:hypothetical protein
MMKPVKPLPYSDEFLSPEEYVSQLLEFVTTSDLFQLFCGGVHILDFFTSDPGLYSTALPKEWQDYLMQWDPMDLMDLLLRDDLESPASAARSGHGHPPPSLVDYIKKVRRFSLGRSFTPKTPKLAKLPRSVALGMKDKKIHEVVNAAGFIDQLGEEVAGVTGKDISHYLDLGSGQNYLGRALASPPYNKHIIAVESREVNMVGAKVLDVQSGLAQGEKLARNKKVFHRVTRAVPADKQNDIDFLKAKAREMGFSEAEVDTLDVRPRDELAATYTAEEGKGFIHYVIGRLENADLADVIHQLEGREHGVSRADLRIMAISLHSCGNLSHHGIKSMVLNDNVKALAIVGCCYNLMTEKLGPPTLKYPYCRPTLQPVNGRIIRESERRDPEGFPLSERLSTYKDDGIRFNITARMMACQAPANWTPEDSAEFMRRHYFRSVLQKIFLDKGVISRVYYDPSQSPSSPSDDKDDASTTRPAGANDSPFNCSTNPVIIGTLPKRSHTSLVAYVRAAITKLVTHKDLNQYAAVVRDRMGDMSDAEIEDYARIYNPRMRELSIVWSLMAFSAGVVESTIVTDRWLFLREHDHVVGEAWVEAMFDYRESPRNLVVVGIKK